MMINRIVLLIIIGLFLSLSGCGYFSPVYGTVEADLSGVPEELSAIRVNPIPDKLGYDLRNAIEKKLNPKGTDLVSKYELFVTLNKSENPQAIRDDRSASRMQIQILVDYQLKEIETGKLLDKGQIKETSSYNRVISEFGSYSSQQDVLGHMAEDIANELYLRTMSVFFKKGSK